MQHPRALSRASRSQPDACMACTRTPVQRPQQIQEACARGKCTARPQLMHTAPAWRHPTRRAIATAGGAIQLLPLLVPLLPPVVEPARATAATHASATGSGPAPSPSSSAPQASASSGIADPNKCGTGVPSIGTLPLDTFRGSNYSFSYPCGWALVPNLDPALGVLASAYNPKDPGAETAAVFAAATDARDTAALGTPQQVGQELADAAPFGELQSASSFTDGRKNYFVVRVQFGGSSAGKFGAVIEYRCVVVSHGTRYIFRATTTRYKHLAFPEVPAIMGAVASSFRVA